MKKYIKFIILFVALVVIGFIVFKTYTAPFTSKPQIKYSELENYLEENSDCLIYVTNKKNTKELNKYFEKNSIEIVYLYLNKKEKKSFENIYGISNLPTLVHFKDGVVEEYMSFDKKEIEDFLLRNGFVK